MASTKPDLTSNVQNVVVYVSNDNFAQAYAVNSQNVPQSQQNPHHNNVGFNNTNHSMASLVKNFSDKPTQEIVNTSQADYFTNVITQNSFQQPILNNVGYQNNIQNGAVLKNFLNNDVLPNKVREECNLNRENNYIEQPYLIVGPEVTPQSVRCDSVRSETAESSCSSLSSSEEGMLVIQNRSPDNSNMVVYDPSVSVRRSDLVLTTVGPTIGPHQTNVGPSVAAHQLTVGPPIGPIQVAQNQNILVASSIQTPKFVTVPEGWKRLVNNGSVIYISPNNTALSSPEQVKEYLLSNGTCKCGLDCHFKYENVFSFDNKIIGKPWVLSPDTNKGDLTKLCNHKRKILTVASLDCKLPDPSNKLRKEYNIKRKKRKIGLPYASSVSVSQILSHRENLSLNQQHGFTNKDGIVSQQVWTQGAVGNTHLISNRLQGYGENVQNQVVRCQDQSVNRVMSRSPVLLNENNLMIQQPLNTNLSNLQLNQPVPQNSSHINSQIIGTNGSMIHVQTPIQCNQNAMSNNQGVVLQGQGEQLQLHQNRVFVNSQPNEPSGPGRPNVQMVPVSITNHSIIRPENQQRIAQPQLYNNSQQYHQIDSTRNVRPFNQAQNGFRPQILHNAMPSNKIHWNNRLQQQNIMQQQQIAINQQCPQPINQATTPDIYERVPPLHLHTPTPVWQEEIRRKKVKLNKVKSRPYVMDDSPTSHAACPNIDVRQISGENRTVIINQQHGSSSPSFMEDPSGYLAQQTALLNNTINRQTGATCGNFMYNTTAPEQNVITISQTNEVPLPSNIMGCTIKSQNQNTRAGQNTGVMIKQSQVPPQKIVMTQHTADSSISHENQQMYTPCQGCITDQNPYGGRKLKTFSRSSSEPGTPNSCYTSDDPVTSSVCVDKHSNQSSPDTRPIQGGTISTSNVSLIDGTHSDPPTPSHHAPTPVQRNSDSSHVSSFPVQQNGNSQQIINQSREIASTSVNYNEAKQESCCPYPHTSRVSEMAYISGVVTTMASGRTVGSNTITSVVAGRASTATVSINSPVGQSLSGSSTPTSISTPSTLQPQAVTVSKSPLEMVQSVVSSIQVPQSQHEQQHIISSVAQASPQISPQIIKHSPTGLPHIFVSSGGQLIVASTGNHGNVMAPPPPKILTSQNAMPPISGSPMVTNVTAAVTQVIPAVAQQVLGQQTMLVNALPTPFVLQPGVTMSMDGMAVGQNVQIPQLITSNLVPQQIQIDNSDPRRTQGLLSPEAKKKGKKRKMPQTVAGMLHIAAQHNSGVVMSQQGFPQQIQMAHSPQGLTAGPVMQALTIVPSKTGGPAQILMNGQTMASTNLGTQQLITNSQPAQQINLLQPVNLINNATGVVQNFPIQQFIVPNIGGSMVMNPDGTATILQDTSNLGMQLQIQNVNGQNVLTPVQNNNMFNGGQSILAAGPAGMVIRAPTSQGKIIQQQHSPGAQFLSPGGGQFVVNGQFSGQLSPLVASVSPSQQVTFSTSPQQIRSNNNLQPAQQEYIQMNGQVGQTLMVPCNAQASNMGATSPNQNTTFVQQNTTIVQQQTTMVSNNQQMSNFQQQNNQHNQQNVGRAATLNLDQQNFIISSNDNKQLQAVVVQQQQQQLREAQNSSNYRQSVSTQTAVNQNTQAVTTNTFCQTSALSTGSLPDTTTLSPLASGDQSPPTVDTTTHTGSTDDGLSPVPSNFSTICRDMPHGRPQSSTMAMVHCVSSSEPDSAEMNIQASENELRSHAICSTPKPEYPEISSPLITYSNKKTTPTHVAFAESSTIGVQYFSDKIKLQGQQDMDTSRNIRKMMIHHRKSTDMMDNHELHSSLFDDDEAEN